MLRGIFRRLLGKQIDNCTYLANVFFVPDLCSLLSCLELCEQGFCIPLQVMIILYLGDYSLCSLDFLLQAGIAPLQLGELHLMLSSLQLGFAMREKKYFTKQVRDGALWLPSRVIDISTSSFPPADTGPSVWCCMFSSCLCGFSVGTPASSHNPN